ncbi:MAG: winged helix-turn-helix transcriptional regulator [Bacteroidales bacterium]
MNMKKLDLLYPTCPVRNVLERMSDKWSLLILCNLGTSETLRYKELNTMIPDISHKMLTNTLKRLEEDRLVSRQAYAEIPPRVEYSLTQTGKSFMPILDQMIGWSLANFEIITKD